MQDNYNPDNDQFLKGLQKVKEKSDKIQKYERLIIEAKSKYPNDFIKDEARKLNKRKKNIRLLILSIVFILTIVTIYFLINKFNNTSTQSEIKSNITENLVYSEYDIIVFNKISFSDNSIKQLRGFINDTKIRLNYLGTGVSKTISSRDSAIIDIKNQFEFTNTIFEASNRFKQALNSNSDNTILLIGSLNTRAKTDFENGIVKKDEKIDYGLNEQLIKDLAKRNIIILTDVSEDEDVISILLKSEKENNIYNTSLNIIEINK